MSVPHISLIFYFHTCSKIIKLNFEYKKQHIIKHKVFNTKQEHKNICLILKFKGNELRGPGVSIFQKKNGNLMALFKNSRRKGPPHQSCLVFSTEFFKYHYLQLAEKGSNMSPQNMSPNDSSGTWFKMRATIWLP